MTEIVVTPNTDNEAEKKNERRSVSLVFQALAHLSSSMASLDRRLKSIEDAANRTSERTTIILAKVQNNMFHIEDKDSNEIEE